MESRAMAAAVVMLAIMISGVVAAIVVVRRPRSTAGKALATLVSLPALFLGGWMWQLDVGMGGRLIGLVVFIAGAAALVRVWRAGNPG